MVIMMMVILMMIGWCTDQVIVLSRDGSTVRVFTTGNQRAAGVSLLFKINIITIITTLWPDKHHCPHCHLHRQRRACSPWFQSWPNWGRRRHCCTPSLRSPGDHDANDYDDCSVFAYYVSRFQRFTQPTPPPHYHLWTYMWRAQRKRGKSTWTSTSLSTLLTDPPDDVVPQPEWGKKVSKLNSQRSAKPFKILLIIEFNLSSTPPSLIHPCFGSISITIITIMLIMLMLMLTCDSGHQLIIVSSISIGQTDRSDVGIWGPVNL